MKLCNYVNILNGATEQHSLVKGLRRNSNLEIVRNPIKIYSTYNKVSIEKNEEVIKKIETSF